MRIAVITTSYPRHPGDASGHFVAAEVDALAARGDAPVVIAPGDDVSAFGWPGVAARLRENPLRVVGAVRWVRHATARVRREGPWGRILAHWAIPCALPIAFASASPLEIVSHGGDVRLLLSLPSPLRARVVGALLTRSTRWRFVAWHLVDSLAASVSAPLAWRLRALAHVEPSPLVIPSRASLTASIEEHAARLRHRAYAVALGRLVASKRLEAAIHAAHARDLDLVVVGEGPDRPRLERLARSVHSHRAHFVGQVARAEAIAWIAGAAVVLHPSRIEGCSTVIREAEALGIPVDRCDR